MVILELLALVYGEELEHRAGVQFVIHLGQPVALSVVRNRGLLEADNVFCRFSRDVPLTVVLLLLLIYNLSIGRGGVAVELLERLLASFVLAFRCQSIHDSRAGIKHESHFLQRRADEYITYVLLVVDVFQRDSLLRLDHQVFKSSGLLFLEFLCR